MQNTADQLRQRGRKIGFVPTMGYLHKGHLSLIRIIKKQCDTIVVSIFINPTQFGPNEDYDRYPRDYKRDEELCRKEGVAIIFYPSAQEMYRENHKTFVVTDDLATRLCGASRPLHFRGVTTIVAKLFNIVKPHVAVFGQKDAQQALILKRMVADLNIDAEMIIAPIIREKDGLALSSRNKYLTDNERSAALVLNTALRKAEHLFKAGEKNAEVVRHTLEQIIASEPAVKLDYLEIVDYETLEKKEMIEENTLIALAAYIGKTRLIDNILIKS